MLFKLQPPYHQIVSLYFNTAIIAKHDFFIKISDFELLKEEPSSHFYSHRNDINHINTRYQMSTTIKPIASNINSEKPSVNAINRLSPVYTTITPKSPPTISRIPYQISTGRADILKQRFEKITTLITPVKSSGNQKSNRQRIVFSDINSNRKGETTTTTKQPIIENRRNYVHLNTTKVDKYQAVNDNKQNRGKEPHESVNYTTERKYISQQISTKNELAPSSSTKWKYIDNFIPTTFKPTQNLIQSNRINNSTKPFIDTNEISFKHKIKNKKVSQVKSKNRQSKDYDYNYYEDISENVSPDYDFIEFKKIK